MARRVPPDGSIIYQRSHELFDLKQGRPLEPGFEPPFVALLDPELPDGRMPTFYESPALIARKDFHAELVALGITNLETVPVVIRHPKRRKDNHDYLLLNIVGRVACIDLPGSKHRRLGDDMRVIDKAVLRPGLAGSLDVFLADEDTELIIASERVYERISAKYDDVWFEELATSDGPSRPRRRIARQKRT